MLIQAGKVLIVFGLAVALVGAGLYLAGRLNIPFGRLPGDIQITRQNITCLIPIATSIILSILLTLILNVLVRWLKR